MGIQCYMGTKKFVSFALQGEVALTGLTVQLVAVCGRGRKSTFLIGDSCFSRTGNKANRSG